MGLGVTIVTTIRLGRALPGLTGSVGPKTTPSNKELKLTKPGKLRSFAA
jgi:hypothetical protein